MMGNLVLIACALLSCFASARGQATEELFELNVLHYNDFHARFEETSPFSGVCNPASAPCIGGFARLYTAVQEHLAAEPDSLLFNAGDTFQGTVWYNFLRWNVTQEFMNMLPHDAHTLGNHEFDHGIDGLIPFLQHLDQPMLAANIDDSLEPSIQGLFQKSVVLERNGRRIGVIGVIIATTNVLASTGQLVFTDEVEAVRSEAELLTAQGIDIIIVLSHCGFDIDRTIAENAGPNIDLIVGGHSHTLLYTGDTPSGETPVDEYPTLVTADDHTVLIVQASAYTKYLGEIKLYIDDDGRVQRWTGEPIYLGNEVVQDPGILELLAPYKEMVDVYGKEVIGESRVLLTTACLDGECNFGSFICDAFLDWVADRAEEGHWHYAHLCLINQGGIRIAISAGQITVEDLLLSTPFENVLEIFELRGDHVLEAIEYSLSLSWSTDSFVGSHMLQVSGIQATYNVSLPVGSRVVDVRVRCIECRVPVYEPLQLDKYYRIVTQSFLGNGGDGFAMFPEHRRNLEIGGIDYEVVQEYIVKQSPIIQGEDGRIILNT